MAERIAINDLKAGMVILCVTEQNGPVKIRKSGLVTSEDMVRGLAEMGVLEVEIDPAQTVEIDAPQTTDSETTGSQATESHTRQLLTGEQRQGHAGASIDHALSEQFNRSLFLPSIQGLPSVWQHYGRKTLSAAVVLSGGFALGWLGANWQTYVDMLSPAPTVVSTPASTVDAEQPVNDDLVASADVSNNEPAENQQIAAISEQPRVLGMPQEDASAVLDAELQAIEPAASDQEPEPVISDDLLRRFNQAVAELDNEPVQSDPVRVRSNDDIPRVDQLPVRLLTRLPSMSFNAHMYASNPLDRWVRVNGVRLLEGEWLNNELQLLEIEPQHVVLEFQGEPFRMAALSDW